MTKQVALHYSSPKNSTLLAELNAMTTVEVILNDGRTAVLPLTEKLDKFLAAHKEELKKSRKREG